VLAGCNLAPTAKGDADRGWSGCSTAGPGQSPDGKKFSQLVFPILLLLLDAFSSSNSSCNA
jgi:hypothetical protein